MLFTMIMLIILVSVVMAGISLAWSLAKFICGLGLFFVCPTVFILAAMLGVLGEMWIPILLVGLFSGGLFRRVR